MRLWGECIVCRCHVLWDGRKWKDPGRGMGTKHVCPTERPTCGAWMPQARERCARRPEHTTEHRTAYAMANARRRYAA